MKKSLLKSPRSRKNPCILLTGSTGFLGSHILKALIEMNFDVIILKRTTSDTSRIKNQLEKGKVYNVDCTDFTTIFSESNVDIVINTVCSFGRKSESTTDVVNTNLLFSLTLLEAAVKHNVKTFINTDSLLSRNVNSYTLSKSQFVEWLQFFSEKIQVVNLRIEHIYGPGDDVKKFLPWLVDQMLNSDQDVSLTSGIQKRDFIYIYDVIAAYMLVIKKRTTLSSKWSEFHVATNSFVAVKDVILIIASELERRRKLDITSRLKFGTIPYRPNDSMKPSNNNNSLIELGWSPSVSVNEGIIKYVNDLLDSDNKI